MHKRGGGILPNSVGLATVVFKSHAGMAAPHSLRMITAKQSKCLSSKSIEVGWRKLQVQAKCLIPVTPRFFVVLKFLRNLWMGVSYKRKMDLLSIV